MTTKQALELLYEMARCGSTYMPQGRNRVLAIERELEIDKAKAIIEEALK